MERKFNFSVDEYYHVYSRGTERREIFLDNFDKERFLKLLFVLNSGKPFKFRDVKDTSYANISRGNPRTAIGAFCLMPNHFHLLLRETEEGGISAFMGKLLTAYSMYFNKKYKRTGGLFEGTFRAEYVDNDNYLKYLFAYIHLNPVKLIEPEWKEKGIANKSFAENYLKKYRYSSYEDYMGSEREENIILSKEVFPEYFDSIHDFKDFITDCLTYKNEEENTQGSPVYTGLPCV
ncbi:MAG: transposase [Candidatus Parcubacteria bacterium]|nr:transposase [Candidatus Parcubacteria bacterium]